LGRPLAGTLISMRLMLWTWVALIAGGIVFFTIVGLAHR
jgi:hypothetical protein